MEMKMHFDMMKKADEAHYMMGGSTDKAEGDEDPDDTKLNKCGIHTAHAFSILSAFTLYPSKDIPSEA
jgi:hypothetical protein